jgi:hypothetical protein
MQSFAWRSLVCAVLVLVATIAASNPRRSFAQTGPDLLVKPWDPGQSIDTSTEAVLEASGPTQENHADRVQLSSYHAFGRWRILPDVEASPRLGYDVLYFDINSHDRALPRHLWDGTVGIAQPVADFNKWFVVLTGAAGYAGDTPFSDPHAAYFTGNVIVGRKFSEEKALVFALNYDGDRTFLPDTPIPAIEYADRYNDHLTYVIGAPINSIRYEPINGLQVDVGWELLNDFSGEVGWEFKRHFFVFTSYTDRLTGFHLSSLPADRRLFLQEHRAEVGFRYNPTKRIRLSVGGGWAFGQEFSEGFDTRGQNPLRHLRDGAFGQALLEIGL